MKLVLENFLLPWILFWLIATIGIHIAGWVITLDFTFFATGWRTVGLISFVLAAVFYIDQQLEDQ